MNIECNTLEQIFKQEKDDKFEEINKSLYKVKNLTGDKGQTPNISELTSFNDSKNNILRYKDLYEEMYNKV